MVHEMLNGLVVTFLSVAALGVTARVCLGLLVR